MLNDLIIDYDENIDEIKKWTYLKGEKKYLEFVKLFNNYNIPVKWKTLDDTFRYDKRLMFNIFRYISMFEDYIRALILNKTNRTFNDMNENYFLREMEIIINEKQLFDGDLNTELLSQCYKDINVIRRTICHNKIILQIGDFKCKLTDFMNVLPINYRENFKKEINNSSKGLALDEKIVITID